MLKIGIDARLYSQTGVGVYLRNLLHYLEQKQNSNLTFYIYFLPEDYKKINFTNKNFVKRLTSSRWHTFSEQLEFNRILYQDNLDLVHFTYFGYPVLYKRKFIATIHDTTPLVFKTGKASTRNSLLYEFKFQAFKYVIANQVKSSKLIITPTNTVKKQLIEIYGIKYTDKIKAIYEGVNFELIESPKKKTTYNFQNPIFKEKNFFIYIGNFYPHKNVENLIKAFTQVSIEAKLILIGPDDFFAKRLLKLIDILHQKERVIFYHSPSKEDLVFFYKNALALVHPSLSEGFGLPLVESMYFNLPIIASNISVFKEILDDQYLAFNPRDPADIAKKINLKLKKNFQYQQLLTRYSFEKMTQKTIDLYYQALI